MAKGKQQTLKPSTQGQLFSTDSVWFHVFRSMVVSGDVAKMGPYATTVYLVIKSHVNIDGGQAWPSVQTISELSGLSERQVMRELKVLAEFKYITIEKVGRSNKYTLRERIPIKNDEGLVAHASWDYVPRQVSNAVSELQNVTLTGDFAGAKIIHIEHLHLNMQIGDHATQTNFNGVTADSIRDPKMREQLAKLEGLSKKGVTGDT
jgi:DNA-binding transcriptional ArsR family regulator